jgi:hypothetical protein
METDILKMWKTCPFCGIEGKMDIGTANVVCINPKCGHFQKVVR